MLNTVFYDSEYKQRCGVCLIDFVKDEKIQQLACKHLFHINCVDITFQSCPLCRREIVWVKGAHAFPPLVSQISQQGKTPIQYYHALQEEEKLFLLENLRKLELGQNRSNSILERARRDAPTWETFFIKQLNLSYSKYCDAIVGIDAFIESFSPFIYAYHINMSWKVYSVYLNEIKIHLKNSENFERFDLVTERFIEKLEEQLKQIPEKSKHEKLVEQTSQIQRKTLFKNPFAMEQPSIKVAVTKLNSIETRNFRWRMTSHMLICAFLAWISWGFVNSDHIQR